MPGSSRRRFSSSHCTGFVDNEVTDVGPVSNRPSSPPINAYRDLSVRAASVTLLAFSLLCISGASPPAVEDHLRAGNAALERGDVEAAAKHYAAAAERADDPGLVAFNRAALHFARGDFREAELDYRRALDDADAPPERIAKAWYNRGAALLHRGGGMDVYRSAIACFDRCLAFETLDEGLKADARHNLELAKIRWAEERKKAAKVPTAISSPPEDHEPRTPKEKKEKSSTRPQPPEPGKGSKDVPNPKDRKSPVPAPPGVTPPEAKQPLPGAGNLKPLLDGGQPQALSAEETREYLRRTAERLNQDRRSLLQALYGQDRPGVRDW